MKTETDLRNDLAAMMEHVVALRPYLEKWHATLSMDDWQEPRIHVMDDEGKTVVDGISTRKHYGNNNIHKTGDIDGFTLVALFQIPEDQR